jgi:2-C-methyl-D-erythritol 2,4-cyclodiphosphate synthase
MRIGLGEDIHRIDASRPLVLGGVTIPDAAGLAGHSDADVLLHAITDAVLGAAGLGDIGGHFPSSDEQWRDADSSAFLREAVALAKGAGYRPENVDSTVRIEKPRLAPHIKAMRVRIASLMGLEPAAVNVKAKTAEGLDAVGEGLAISANAIVLLASLD